MNNTYFAKNVHFARKKVHIFLSTGKVWLAMYIGQEGYLRQSFFLHEMFKIPSGNTFFGESCRISSFDRYFRFCKNNA